MTMLDTYLLAVFAAIWLVPLTMAVWWEHRLKQSARPIDGPDAEGSTP